MIKDHPDYKCKREPFLHDYSSQITETDTVIIEQCIRCGHKIGFNKINGKIDNKRYGETHLMWYLQASDPLFEKIYGKPKLPEINKRAKMSFEERKHHITEELNQALKESRWSGHTVIPKLKK